MSRYSTRGKDEGEEARRRKQAQPTYDRREQAAEAEDSRAGSAEAMLDLQQTHGNRYVQRVVGKIRAKLVVNPPDDVYEKEADRVADAVTGASTSDGQSQVDEGERFATKQASGKEHQPTAIPEGIEAGINAARGGGESLPSSIRSSLEPQLRHDFSQVYIHTDARADKLSQQLGAKAFTTGKDVFFREGAYQPGSGSGQALIAHELTHVVQQDTSQVSRQAAETEEAPAEFKEEAQKELKDDVDKLKARPEPERVRDMVLVAGNCQAKGMDESSYKWAVEETAEAASTMMKRKTTALDVKSAKEEMVDQLVKILEDVVKRGEDPKVVEAVFKEALERAKAQMEAAAKNLKPGSGKASARKVATKAAQVQLLGGDATKAVEAVRQWEEEESGGKEQKR